MATKYQPVGDKLLIQPERLADKSKGGILYPEVGQKGFICRGEVLAVGRGLRLQDGGLASLEIKVGDVVIFDRRVGEALEEGKPDGLRVLREHEVICKVCE